uniref:Uncharacterized protein n=1 Tax=Nelumbo nucifera TaxID=4432 RepID=A0A822ZX56_NELNU|nr:TPA_asm: hypothetical protein HUJ06_017872 [Nelumbo nucifera]
MALLDVMKITTVFKTGKFSVEITDVDTSHTKKASIRSVLVFLHGFAMRNCYYTNLFKHKTSHGFICVALQLYNLLPPSGYEEIESTTTVTVWLSARKEESISISLRPTSSNLTPPPLRYHIVATEYGHLDMLDDNPPGIMWALSGWCCKSGQGPKNPLRRCVGGIVVAFLRAFLESDHGVDLKAILGAPEFAPVKLDPVEYDEA